MLNEQLVALGNELHARDVVVARVAGKFNP